MTGNDERTRAINYVWSNKLPVGSSWLNAFTDRAHDRNRIRF
ncbi:MAG: DUF3047 domain-containing protein [Pseudomonadota bacterium]